MIPSTLKPITAAVYQTIGSFVDSLRKDDKLIGKISRHFYRHHKEDYKAELHNLAIRRNG